MTDKITTYIKLFHEDPPLETYVVQVQICRLTHRQSQNLKNALIDLFEGGFITDNVESTP